ncbi:MAG TPA: hypothetical protein VF263_10995 [Longimicrobiaceae bacterium]
MPSIPLLRIGLGLAAVVLAIAAGTWLLGRRGPEPGAETAAAAAPAPESVAEHWRALAPALVALDTAPAIRDRKLRGQVLGAVEEELERAEASAPAAPPEYREALGELRRAVDDAGDRKGEGDGKAGREGAARRMAEARARLDALAARGGTP